VPRQEAFGGAAPGVGAVRLGHLAVGARLGQAVRRVQA